MVLTDVIAGACLLLAALLSFTASVGLLRFPDLLSRTHAAAKPQVVGVLLALVGIGVKVDAPTPNGLLLVVAFFQIVTIPLAGHLVGRAAYRTGQVRDDLLYVDELADTVRSHEE